MVRPNEAPCLLKRSLSPNSAKKMKMNVVKSRPFLFASILVGLVLSACSAQSSDGSSTKQPAEPVVQVETIEATYRSNPQTLKLIGTSRAQSTAIITPETEGRTQNVRIQSGQYVSAGEVVLELERSEELLAVEAAQIAVEQAQQLLDRYAQLAGAGSVSALQQDEAENTHKAAKVTLSQAKLALAERAVRAPFSGHVGIVDINVGTRIGPSSEIATLDDRSTLFIDFNVPEEQFGTVTLSDEISVSPFPEPDTSYTATVSAIDSGIDAASRTFSVRLTLDNSEDHLRPGMSFLVSLPIEARAFPTVPEAAIFWSSRGAYVWRVVDGYAERTPVNIIARDDGLAFVDGELPQGAYVVSQGVQKVRHGDAITGTERSASTPASNVGGAAQ